MEESINPFFNLRRIDMHLIEFENYEVRPTEEFFLIKPLRDLHTKYKKDYEKFM